MQLEILTPEKKVYSGEATSVLFPGANGFFQVLNNHAAMVAALKEGNMKVETGTETNSYNITGGFVEVLKNKVTVLIEGLK